MIEKIGRDPQLQKIREDQTEVGKNQEIKGFPQAVKDELFLGLGFRASFQDEIIPEGVKDHNQGEAG